ncbi:LysR family transcriptional regulator [Dyella sp. BiH032]|uniref:LysR family transcriptional regulator n=1 Tax=Dyella sp. BiH032 TaxID=3075430 RepID=UPI0028933E43|nr:LysR family transcriptional regulator [Dyella sp. BiH032]WNL46446.1 LysR family transcriptional regulator [Dyella sp. BiH032]
MDQLTALRVFVRIAESGGFGKASDALDMPRATVTKLIQELEQHLGVKLFQRSTRKVSVTDEGKAYYQRATQVLADLDEMDTLFSDPQDGPRGRLRVDVGSSLANLILLPRLVEFRAAFPHIRLELGVSDRHVDLVGDAVDCVIRGGALTDTSLVARRIASLDYVTCASPLYLRARGTPAHPDDLREKHDVVGYFSSLTGRPFRLLFQRGEDTMEIDPRSSHGLLVNESTAHLNALVHGLGVGQTFGFMAAPYLESGRLVHLLPDWQRPLHDLHVVFERSKHENARLRAFVEWVARVFQPYDRHPGRDRG